MVEPERDEEKEREKEREGIERDSPDPSMKSFRSSGSGNRDLERASDGEMGRETLDSSSNRNNSFDGDEVSTFELGREMLF